MLFWVIAVREYSAQPLSSIEVIVIGWAIMALFLLSFHMGSINQKLEMIQRQLYDVERKRWQKEYTHWTK